MKPAIERFAEKFQVNGLNECWPWKATKHRQGYGMFFYGGRLQCAHRVMYIFEHGVVPPGALVRHSCDNPGCVNPNHLKLGTQQDNMNDMVLRGRSLHRHGVRNPNARLTQTEVDRVRELHESGFSYNKIVKAVGCSKATVQRICTGGSHR